MAEEEGEDGSTCLKKANKPVCFTYFFSMRDPSA